jgi:hypothetical protein
VELAETGPDLISAQAIATAGGGILSDDPHAVAAECIRFHTDSSTLHYLLWPYLIMAAILLWPIDLLLRKVL